MSTIVNPGTTPQVYTEDGKMIPAGERIENVTLDEVGQAAVDDGRLRVVEEEKKSAPRKSTRDKAESAQEERSE